MTRRLNLKIGIGVFIIILLHFIPLFYKFIPFSFLQLWKQVAFLFFLILGLIYDRRSKVLLGLISFSIYLILLGFEAYFIHGINVIRILFGFWQYLAIISYHYFFRVYNVSNHYNFLRSVLIFSGLFLGTGLIVDSFFLLRLFWDNDYLASEDFIHNGYRASFLFESSTSFSLLSIILIFCLLLLHYHEKNMIRSLLTLLSIVIFTFGLALTGSRQILFPVMFILSLYLIISILKARFYILTGFIILFFLSIFFVDDFGELIETNQVLLDRITDGGIIDEDRSFTDRIKSLTVNFDILSVFKGVFFTACSGQKAITNESLIWHHESALAVILIETGFFGMCLYFLLFISIVASYQIDSKLRPVLLLVLLFYFINSLTSPNAMNYLSMFGLVLFLNFLESIKFNRDHSVTSLV
jgi:hypothetical protein